MVMMGWGLTVATALVVGLYWWDWRNPEDDRASLATSILGGLGVLWLILLGAEVLQGGLGRLLQLYWVFLAYGLSLVLVFLLVSWQDGLSRLGIMVSPVALGIFVMGMVARPGLPNPEVVGATYRTGLHVVLLSLGYGGLTVCFICGVYYLWTDRLLKANQVGEQLVRAPSLEDIDQGLIRSLGWGLGFLLLGLGVGAVHAYMTPDLGWQLFRDPNVLGTVLAALLFGIIYVLRLKSLFTNRRIVHLSITGFVLIGLMFFLMNLLDRAHLFS